MGNRLKQESHDYLTLLCRNLSDDELCRYAEHSYGYVNKELARRLRKSNHTIDEIKAISDGET